MLFDFGKTSFKEIKQYYQEKDLREPNKKALELDEYGISQESYDNLNNLVNQYNDKNDSNLSYEMFTRCEPYGEYALYILYKVYSQEIGVNLFLPERICSGHSSILVPTDEVPCVMSEYVSGNYDDFERSIIKGINQEEATERLRIADEKLRLKQEKIIKERKQRYKDEIKRLGRIIQSRFGESEEYDSTVSILTIMEKLQNQLDKM